MPISHEMSNDRIGRQPYSNSLSRPWDIPDCRFGRVTRDCEIRLCSRCRGNLVLVSTRFFWLDANPPKLEPGGRHQWRRRDQCLTSNSFRGDLSAYLRLDVDNLEKAWKCNSVRGSSW